MSNKVPQIRFNGYSDAWVQRKLVDITTKIGSGKTPKGGSEVYQSNGIALLRSQNVTNDHVDMTDVAFVSEEINNTMLGSEVQHNDVLLNITGASIGRSAVYKHTETANVNQHVSIIRLTQGFDPDFVQQLISSFQGQNQIQAFQAGGAREGLNFKQIGLMTFAFPSYDEQLKVSSVVSRLSDLIAANQRKINLLKEQKKGYLQKMFPKNGVKVPELRFAGFADDWEQRKLGELGSTFTGLTGKTKEDFGHGDAKFVTYMNVFQNAVASLEQLDSVEIDPKQNEVKKGDVFFTTSSETPEEVGMSSVWKYNYDDVYLNSFTFGYRPNIEFDLDYLAAMLRSTTVRKKITFLAQGISRYNISKTKMMDIGVPVPSLEEQAKIGAFLSNVEQTITLHQRKLDLLKEQKKGFLQKMFV